MLIRRRAGWEIPERDATDEAVYLDRRRFLARAGLAGAGALAARCIGGPGEGLRGAEAVEAARLRHPESYPAARNPAYTLDRPLTDESLATTYNNFYEFRNDKRRVPAEAAKLTLRPWAVEIAGRVERPLTLDVDQILDRIPAEERLYRHRCVETWSMAVPWTGVPMRALVELARPLSDARFVRFVSFMRPHEAIGQLRDGHYPWPYYEGLALDEATNELTLLATGLYGKPLQPQNGAPLRIVTPWKYGYKSIKSIVSIEFVTERPKTFWNDLQPLEYDFVSNVDPLVPHPRWSQATERMLGTDERRPTLPYNGYADQVAHLYQLS